MSELPVGQWSTCWPPSLPTSRVGGESRRHRARERFAFVRMLRREFLITTSAIRTSRDGWRRCPARVVANGRGADFVMTIFQPPELDDEAFDRELAVTATELTTLKGVLERP